MKKQIDLHPAYLWIGSQETLENHLNIFLKKIFCELDGCAKCLECKKISKNNHHSIRRLSVELNQYNVAQIDEIIKTLSFSLDQNEHFFFIIDQADLLGNAAANRLLKSLEEPPKGYHFILLTQRKELVLQTITSRCVIETFDLSGDNYSDPLISCFTVDRFQDVDQFIEIFENNKLLEANIHYFIDSIYLYWTNFFKKAIQNNDSKKIELSKKTINLLDDQRKVLPMPGSSKIFIKNLYMKFLAIED